MRVHVQNSVKLQNLYHGFFLQSKPQKKTAVDTSSKRRAHRDWEDKNWGKRSDLWSVGTASCDAEGLRADSSPPCLCGASAGRGYSTPNGYEQRPTALHLRTVQLFLRQMAAPSWHLPSLFPLSYVFTNDTSSRVSP